MPRYIVQIDEQEYDIDLQLQGGNLTASVNGQKRSIVSYPLNSFQQHDSRRLLIVEHRADEVDVRLGQSPNDRTVLIRGREVPGTIEDYALAQMRKVAGVTSKVAVETVLKAPMPGLVVAIKVLAGEAVKKGQALVVIEAMKMENIIKAKADATIKQVHVSPGQSVEKGERLLEFAV